MIGWSREVGPYSILIVGQPMIGWSREVVPYSIRHSFQVGRGLEARAASRLRGSRPRYHRPSKKHRTRFCLDGTPVFHNFFRAYEHFLIETDGIIYINRHLLILQLIINKYLSFTNKRFEARAITYSSCQFQIP